MTTSSGEETVQGLGDIVPDHNGPFITDAMLVPGSPLYSSHFEEGYVSDEEGHPDLTRISPCTFASWATGCAPEDWTQKETTAPKPPIIPARTSSLNCLGPKRYSTPLIDTPHRPDGPRVPTFDTVRAVKEIGALKCTLSKLVNEKEQLRDEIGALRQERAELQAKMEKVVG